MWWEGLYADLHTSSLFEEFEDHVDRYSCNGYNTRDPAYPLGPQRVGDGAIVHTLVDDGIEDGHHLRNADNYIFKDGNDDNNDDNVKMMKIYNNDDDHRNNNDDHNKKKNNDINSFSSK